MTHLDPRLPFFGVGSDCGNLYLQRRRAVLYAENPKRHLPPVFISFPELADCRECDMCGGCETHEGCLTDPSHIEFFMQFASLGETPCGQQHQRHGITYTCALPDQHAGEWHMARTGDGWPLTA